MMNEYIERKKVLSKAAPVAGCFSNMISVYDVIMLPAADVAPVRHGRWIMKKTSTGVSYTVCSYCNTSVKYNDEYGIVIMNLKGVNYCPNCGAKMDEVSE